MIFTVRVLLNNTKDGRIHITCRKPPLGGAGHARPYETELEAKRALLALVLLNEDVDIYLRKLRDMPPMEMLALGDYDISDETLRALGFLAV